MKRGTLVLVILLTVILLLGGCGPRANTTKVSLYEGSPVRPSPPTAKPDRPPLRVAVAAVISPKETLKSYTDILQYLEEKLDRPVELIQRQTYAEINALIRDGNIDLAFVCTNAYVDGQREFGLELLVAPQVGGASVYYSYLIVPGDSGAKELKDLRGKVFAFSDPLSTTGRLVPVYWLKEMGETPERFFKKTVYTYSHDNTIKAVAEKLVDGGSVDSLVYDATVARHPDYSHSVKVIRKSQAFGNPPVVVPPGLDPQLKKQLRDLFLSMHLDQKGKEILSDLLIDRFIIPDDRLYDPVREMSIEVGKQP